MAGTFEFNNMLPVAISLSNNSFRVRVYLDIHMYCEIHQEGMTGESQRDYTMLSDLRNWEKNVRVRITIDAFQSGLEVDHKDRRKIIL